MENQLKNNFPHIDDATIQKVVQLTTDQVLNDTANSSANNVTGLSSNTPDGMTKESWILIISFFVITIIGKFLLVFFSIMLGCSEVEVALWVAPIIISFLMQYFLSYPNQILNSFYESISLGGPGENSYLKMFLNSAIFMVIIKICWNLIKSFISGGGSEISAISVDVNEIEERKKSFQDFLNSLDDEESSSIENVQKEEIKQEKEIKQEDIKGWDVDLDIYDENNKKNK